MPRKNDIYKVNITDINNLGFGVCRVDGIVTFVSGAVAGDVAKIRIIKVTKSYLVARTEEIISRSESRITPECPVFSSCGGCVYSHVSYEKEKLLKKEYVKSAFVKAGLPDIKVHDICTPSNTKHYRNKAQYPVAPDCTYGYFARKSHRIVRISSCPLVPSIFDKIAKAVCDFLKEKKIPIYNEERHEGLVRHIYIRSGFESGQIMLCLVINGTYLPFSDEFVTSIRKKFPEIATVVLDINDKKTNVILGGKIKVLFGEGYICDTLLGNKYKISALSFYQINPVTAAEIYKKAIELADIKKGEKVTDLFCGIGTIALSVAKHTEASGVVGVEIIPDAVENAKENAEINNINNARFYCGDANDRHIEESDVIFVDPPRKGLAPELIFQIAQIGANRVVYVSCSADTLARDCALFAKEGYTTHEVFPFDMFPRTGHVENVLLLSRKDK